MTPVQEIEVEVVDVRRQGWRTVGVGTQNMCSTSSGFESVYRKKAIWRKQLIEQKNKKEYLKVEFILYYKRMHMY